MGMAETLLIRLAPGTGGFRDWLQIDEQGRAEGPVQAGAPDTGAVNGSRRVVVLVPGAAVFLCQARVPGRNRQRVLRAVPYALEEQLADDVEDLHFALGPAEDEGSYPVAVVNRAQMDAWVSLLRENGISADQFVPEVLAVPPGDGWSLVVDGETVLVRIGGYGGFAAEPDTLATLLELQRSQEQAPETAQLFGSTVLDLEGVDVELIEDDAQPLGVLARGWAQGPHIDLLQGAYSKREEWGRMLRPWKASAALLLVALLLSGVTTGINYARLSAQQEQLSAEIEAVYRKTFPKARRIVNPRAQMEQELKRLQRQGSGGQADFLFVLAETANVVRTAKGITINGASYRDGRLDLDLLADNLQILDTLKQQLDSGGRMRAEIQSATTEANQKVKSRIRIQGVGS
jgi:general secretion pathway protein L